MRKVALLFIAVLSFVHSFGQANQTTESDITYEVEVTTNIGKINFILYNDTPLHRDNLLKLIDFDYYNDMLFHRVIKGHVIQTGDPESKEQLKFKRYGEDGYKYKVDAEIKPHLYHFRGAVGMAREGDEVNPDRQSSGSHFYIVQGKNDLTEDKIPANLPDSVRQRYLAEGGRPHLDGAYTIFGEVVMGMDIVDKICEMTTDSNDRPIYDVIIENVRVFKKRK